MSESTKITKQPDSVLKIEKGIPMPPRAYALMGSWRKTLMAMEVGDSFLVEHANVRDIILRVNTEDNHGMKVATRKVDGKGYRIWRVK